MAESEPAAAVSVADDAASAAASDDLALLQSRLSSLERDLTHASRRSESKEEEVRLLKQSHARELRAAEERSEVLEGRLSIAEHEVKRLQALATAAEQKAAAAAAAAASSPTSPSAALATSPLSAANLQGRRVPPIPGAASNLDSKRGSVFGNADPNSPGAAAGGGPRSPQAVAPPPTLPLRPLLPYTEDSPFFRKEEAVMAGKVNVLSVRLKKIVVKAKEFSQAVGKLAETAAALSAELGGSWTDVEGGLDAIIAAAAHTAAAEGGGASGAPGSEGLAAKARSSIIQSEELVSLATAFGKLGSMLSTFSDIGQNLAVNVDAFLVSALVDFRTKHIQTLLDTQLSLKRSMDEYESALAKRLNKKREKSLFGSVTGVVTEKARKKAALEEEEIKASILVASACRRSYELQRLDYTTLLNEVLLTRRMELIEMICASFLGFITFFHEGNYVADTIKREVDLINRHIQIKRSNGAKSGEGIKEERRMVERALEIPAPAAPGAAAAASSSPPPAALSGSPVSSVPASTAALERALTWRVKDSFPTSSTASGMLSPQALAQQKQGTVVITVPSHIPGRAPGSVPSPYAHASIRGKIVPIEKEGYLRKQSSNLRGDFKARWFILQNGQLFYVRDAEDLNPVHVQNVLLCTVRLSQKSDLDLCFDLISPNKRVYTLQAETDDLRREWMEVFANCSESLLNASGTMLTAAEQGMTQTELKTHTESKANATNELRALNPVCVDCGAKDPDWACINLGIMICIECSGIHRSMGVHISKVRSISLDSWTTELLDLMRAVGNAKFNALYEGALHESDEEGTEDLASALHAPKPNPSSSRDEREAFIACKYQRKAFLSKSVLAQASLDPREHLKELMDCAKRNDVVGIMNAMALGVNIDDAMVAVAPATAPADAATTTAATTEDASAEPSAAAAAAPVTDVAASAAAEVSAVDPSSLPNPSPDFSSPLSTVGGGDSPSLTPSPAPSPSHSTSTAAAAAVSASSTAAAPAAAGSSVPEVVYGTRALHVAAQHDAILSLELLLQNNARENLLNEDHKTALQVATAAGAAKCQARLTKHDSGKKKA